MTAIAISRSPAGPIAAWLPRLVRRWRALRRLARYRRTARTRHLAAERWLSAYTRHSRESVR